jgi:hypothetical protein
VVNATDPYGPILGFLDRSCYFFFQVAPRLYSRGSVYLVADSLLLRESCSAWNRTWNLWINMNSGYLNTEVVTTGNIIGVGENQADLRLHPMQMGRLMEKWPYSRPRHKICSLHPKSTSTRLLLYASQWFLHFPSSTVTVEARTVPVSLPRRPTVLKSVGT